VSAIREIGSVKQFVLNHGQWLVLALAAVLRFWNLGFPKALVFDETYYVKDAWSLSHLGYESQWPDNANGNFVAGQVDLFTHAASFVVHPQLGKWLIALGMNLFGAQNAFSWRIMTALAGVVGVWLVMLVARRLFKSSGWAQLAGLLFAIDGLTITMSRTALLDNFLMVFALLAFYFMLRDQSQVAEELAFRAARADDAKTSGVIWRRGWLVLCALSLGLATSIKWSGLYFALGFGLYIVISETLTRRRLGLKHWVSDGLIGQTLANLVLMVPIYVGTYVAGWSSWLLTHGGWDRTWANDPSNRLPGLLGLLPLPLQSLIDYHQQQYGFHVNLHTPHSYMSNPLTWLFVIRPVSFYYQGNAVGKGGCAGPGDCASAITALGNPLIWWAAAISVIYLVIRYFGAIVRVANLRRDNVKAALPQSHRVQGLTLLGLAGGYLPWLMYMGRTVFQFYSIAFFAWMIFALVYCLKTLVEESLEERRAIIKRRVKIFVILCVAMSVWLSNIWFGYQTPYWYWLLHMWLPSWI
jgi:dolichyl-phosphate-mannose--protein O-mannosyl transferase